MSQEILDSHSEVVPTEIVSDHSPRILRLSHEIGEDLLRPTLTDSVFALITLLSRESRRIRHSLTIRHSVERKIEEQEEKRQEVVSRTPGLTSSRPAAL